MKKTLEKLKQKKPLSASEMGQAMETLVTGRATDDEIEAFLLGLHEKGETVTEIVAAAHVMRKHSVKLTKRFPDLLDTCGTGGDGRQSLNISTLAAMVAASCGAQVGKHGNRSVSSTCGSADLLEMLGVKIDLSIAAIERCIQETGFGFFFAPLFHPATRFAIPARKKIKGKTLFNILGPLSNPASACYQLIGVYEEALLERMIQALRELGLKRALVVHGTDGLDEITLCSETKLAELDRGQVKIGVITPEQFGFSRVEPSSLSCSSKEQAKESALNVLEGEQGAKRQIVCFNAGAALYICNKARSIAEGVEQAAQAIQKGLALQQLKSITRFCQNS